MAERDRRLAPLTGIAFVALVVVSILISGDQPAADAGPTKVAAYFASHDGRTVAQVVMLAYAAIVAAVYFTVIAQFFRDRGSRTMATLTLIGGVFAAVGCGLAAGMSAALSETSDNFSAGQLQVLNAVSEDLFWPIMVGGMVLSTLAQGVAMLRTHALPKALGIITVIVGVVGISGIGSWFGFMGAGAITLVVAGYVAARNGPVQSITLPEMPGQRVNADVSTSEKTSAS
jgi:hypothetical protein